MAESDLIFQKCGECGNFYPLDDLQCLYCDQGVRQPDFRSAPPARPRKVKQIVWALCALLGVALAVLILRFVVAELNRPGASAPEAPTVVAEPTATLRPKCIDRHEDLADLLLVMITGLAGSGARIKDMQADQDQDREGVQNMLILFQGYDRRGQYRDGRLYLDLDDLTCDIVGFDLVWQ